MPEAALAGLSADLLPQQLADDAPVTDADGMLLAAPPGLAEVLNGFRSPTVRAKRARSGSCNSW